MNRKSAGDRWGDLSHRGELKATKRDFWAKGRKRKANPAVASQKGVGERKDYDVFESHPTHIQAGG